MDHNGLLSDQILDRFKYEVAENLGLLEKIREQGWSEVTSKDCGAIGGRIGGNMVRVLLRNAEEQLCKKGKS